MRETNQNLSGVQHRIVPGCATVGAQRYFAGEVSKKLVGLIGLLRQGRE
jgi:hypothetical protein